LPKVFDIFFRADPSRTQEIGGYGLGLSIAITIIDRLGGEIHVTSIENECTTFTLQLECNITDKTTRRIFFMSRNFRRGNIINT
jgi:signal transduction histidine kinase